MKRGSQRADYSQPLSSVRAHRYVRRSIVVPDSSRQAPDAWDATPRKSLVIATRRIWARVRSVFRTTRLHTRTAWDRLLTHWRARNWNVMAMSVCAVVILVASIVLPFFAATEQEASYNLAPAKGLLEPTPSYMQDKLKFDAKQQLYQFNQNGTVAQNTGSSLNVGSTSYSASLPAQLSDSSQGITLTDISSKQSINLKPQFSTHGGRAEQGHVVYPLTDSNAQLVYSFKDAGVKEDIVLYQAPSDTAQFSYQLQLPDGMVARVQQDGSVGIFGGDPTLFGNISYGSDTDRALVDKAKQNSAKNHLYYVIPAPAITGKSTNGVKAHFSLNGDMLTVTATGLSRASYPLSIDPSFVMSPNSCSWQTNNNDDGSVAYGTTAGSCNISRPTLSGGTVGWTANTNNSAATGENTSVAAYNGFLYLRTNNTVYYGAINPTTGVVSTPVATTSQTGDANGYGGIVVVNGYIYMVGGNNASNKTYYAKIAASGNITSGWIAGPNLNTGRDGRATTAYNGRIYVAGGCISLFLTCQTITATTEYATVRGDGSLSAWTISTSTSNGSLPVALWSNSLAAYNGWLYSVGGQVGNTGLNGTSAVYRVPVNSDGSLSTWITDAVALPTTLYGQGVTISNGYLYSIAGWASNTAVSSITYMAKIYASGAIGPFQTTGNIVNNARTYITATNYMGKLYFANGCNNANYSTCGGAEYQDIQYAAISTTPGTIAAFNGTGTGANSAGAGVYDTQANARSWPSVIAYGGYMYIVGGLNVTAGTYLASVLYAPLNTDGTVGTWKATTKSLNVGRSGAAVAITNGYLYVIGGNKDGTSTGYLNDTEYAPIASSGDITTAFTDDTTHVFTTARQYAGAAAYNGYLYIVGGRYNNNSNSLGDLQYTPLTASTGALGAWTPTSQSLPTLEALPAVVSSGGYVYVIGGNKASTQDNTVYFSKFDSTGDITTAFQSAPTLPTGRYGAGASVSNGYIYVASGYGGGELTDSLYAAICTGSNTTTQFTTNCNGSSTPGTTSSWNSGPTLSNVGHGLGVVTYNGYLYTVGGCQSQGVLTFQCSSSANTYNNVQYAQIYNGAGGIDAGWTAGPNLGTAVWAQPVVAANGYLYSLGGCTSFFVLLSTCNGITNASQYATINPNGSLGSWQTGTVLHDSVFGEGAVTANGYIYILGGCPSTSSTCAAPLNTVYSALICTGSNTTGGCTGSSTPGTFGTWNTLSTFTTARWGGQAVIANGYIYLAGGTSGNAGNVLNDVQSAQILPNGGLGSWGSVGSGSTFTTARYNLSLAAYGNYLYLGSGSDSGGSPLGDVQYAAVQANGALGSWQSTSSLSILKSSSFAAYSGYLYAYGGTGTNQLQYAPIYANGMLGNWTTTPGYSAGTVEYSAATISNGFIYKVGGGDSSATSKADTAYAPLQTTSAVSHYAILLTTDKDTLPADFFASLGLESPQTNVSVGLAGATASNVVFSSVSTTSNVSSGTKYNFSNTSGISYYWVPITLDDSKSMTFGETSGSSLSYFQLNYHPNPSMRLRGGKTFNSGVQQSLDAP